MVSQLEVAKAAGVSPSTASLALNNHPRVSAKTTLHVQTVARRLGYVANHAARQLIRSRFGITAGSDPRQIGVMSCYGDAGPGPLGSTYLAFLNGVEQAVSKCNGFLVFLRQTEGRPSPRLADLTRSGTVEGWIAFGQVNDKYADALNRLERPWVVLGDHHCTLPVHQVTMDFEMMGRLAVRHLVELGHRRIAFVGSFTSFPYQREILSGYRKGISDAGLDSDPALVVTRPHFNAPPGEVDAAMERLWKLPSRPTAVVYGEPGESELALAWCGRQGISVPEDLSLVFCESADSLPFVEDICRVEASAIETGSAAASLLAEVAGQADVPTRRVLVTPRVVPGWSSAAAK